MFLLLPRMYERRFEADFHDIVLELSEIITQTTHEELDHLIKTFAYEHHADVVLELRNNKITSNYHDWDEFDQTDTLRFHFTDQNHLSGEIFSISVLSSMLPVDHIIALIISISPLFFLIAFVISILVSWFHSQALARPIKQISEASEKMQLLDLNMRCESKRTDEIGTLAHNLNELADKLSQSLNGLQDVNSQLEKEVEKTKIRELQRKDFFIAASHELKTPLTILTNHLEGLTAGYGIYQDRDLYLAKARKITDDMSNLVSKLLSAAQLQTAQNALTLQQFNIGKILEEVCTNYEGLAEQHKISLTYYGEKDIFVLVDRNYLKTALSNIFSNAIVHSPRGGLVDIQLESQNDHVLLTIENYKSKITEADLEQLFEPFYRTDKSRSRYTGGSGLGLFIIRRILELHHFEFGIRNSNNGVIFEIKMPLKNG